MRGKTTWKLKDQEKNVRTASSPNLISGNSNTETISGLNKEVLSLESTENKVKYVESIFNNGIEGNRVLDSEYISFYYNKNKIESNNNKTKESKLLIKKTKQE